MSFNTLKYYDTGELMAEGNMVDGKYDGVVNTYWKNGNLQTVCTCVMNVLNGECINYDEDGSELSRVLWTDGTPEGIPPDPPEPPE